MFSNVLPQIPSLCINSESFCDVHCDKRSLHVQIKTSQGFEQALSERISKIIGRKIPNARLLSMHEDRAIVLRLHHCALRVEQADTITCRIARLSGVECVFSEIKDSSETVIYAGRLRGFTSVRSPS
ncbi:MAG: hypothetical protein HON65_01205 [Rhodospirillales bacterium]|jgi:hypothetical protein|nr:hypothetical protein [Rhodospirillales bacterium]